MNPVKEKEPPYRTIIYNRSGNLASETRLDTEKAYQFMRVADMRRNFVIVDSDRRPESNVVAVKSDTLAFRSINPFSKLTEVRVGLNPFYTLMTQPDTFEIQIHERIIDDRIRKDGVTDRIDYQDKFIKNLNRSVSSALAQGLMYEKLGFRDQSPSYFAYVVGIGIPESLDLMFGRPFEITPIEIALICFLYTPGIHYLTRKSTLSHERFPWVRENWRECFLPLVPVDRWARGRLFLALHGNKLIVPRS